MWPVQGPSVDSRAGEAAQSVAATADAASPPASAGAAPEALRRLQGVEQGKAILAHLLRIGLALGVDLRQTRILNPFPIALVPGRWGDPAQPVGRDRGQVVQGRAQRFPEEFEAVEHPDGSPHVRRIRPLLAVRFEDAKRLTVAQQFLQQQFFGLPAKRRSRNALSAEK